MCIRLLVASSLIFISNLSVSQLIWCNEDSLLKEIRQNGLYDQFLNLVKAQEKNPSINTRSEIWYQVVVHVVARESYQRISEAQVIQQLDVLNNDFAGRGRNINNLPEEFRPLVANTEIRFCLASVDPAGNPTDGITYTLTDVRDIALQATGPNGQRSIFYDQLGGKTGWDPSRYINIWVGEYGSFLGSASFPGAPFFPEEIGLLIDIRAFGALGDAAANGFYGRGHTLTHEMGHFFGLLHIWGGNTNTCDDSDDVDDTPNTSGPHFDCPSGRQQSCGVSNMYQNFMDLTDDRCLAAFTHGQSARMHATINVFYPDLGAEGPCHSVIQPFESWWAELMWAHDRSSRQYVIYHPDGYSRNIQLDVFSVDGRLILHDSWEGNQSYLLDLNSNASGIYFVRISDGQHDKIRKVVSY